MFFHLRFTSTSTHPTPRTTKPPSVNTPRPVFPHHIPPRASNRLYISRSPTRVTHPHRSATNTINRRQSCQISSKSFCEAEHLLKSVNNPTENKATTQSPTLSLIFLKQKPAELVILVECIDRLKGLKSKKNRHSLTHRTLIIYRSNTYKM